MWSPVTAQSISELESRKGFKDIKLFTEVTKYALEKDGQADHSIFNTVDIYKPVKGEYESIGSIKVKDLEVQTYDNLIFQIKVITEKDTKLYRALSKAFGKPEFSLAKKSYFWEAPSLILYYQSIGSDKLELKYYSFEVEQKYKADKKEEIAELSEEF
jgi:hypothetical protein